MAQWRSVEQHFSPEGTAARHASTAALSAVLSANGPLTTTTTPSFVVWAETGVGAAISAASASAKTVARTSTRDAGTARETRSATRRPLPRRGDMSPRALKPEAREPGEADDADDLSGRGSRARAPRDVRRRPRGDHARARARRRRRREAGMPRPRRRWWGGEGARGGLCSTLTARNVRDRLTRIAIQSFFVVTSRDPLPTERPRGAWWRS